MPLLTQAEIQGLVSAVINGGIDPGADRRALFQFVNPKFVAALPLNPTPTAQLLLDLGKMNLVERLANGEVPLDTYLRNVDMLLSGMEEQKVIRAALSRVSQRATGAPRVDVDPGHVPEIKEKIVHQDDMVTFAFMEAGVRAAAAVAKLRVPRSEAGQPRLLPGGAPMAYLGTGWLLTDSLLMTNHHVINARNDGESAASEPDLRLQARNTIIQFDYDGDGLAGTVAQAQVLECWNAALDYAIVRIEPTGRPPLKRSSGKIEPGSGPLPVNIIQHPGGHSKRYGIRNNLVSGVTDTEIRYFTDTEGGSSGSPVLNDSWEVVALHRGSTYVSNVQFQGKSTAYVNIGTPLPAIMQDLRNRMPQLANEIAA